MRAPDRPERSSGEVTSARTIRLDNGYGIPAEFHITFSSRTRPDVRLDFSEGVVTKVTFEATEEHPEVLAGDVRDLPLSDYRDLAVEKRAYPVRVRNGQLDEVITAEKGFHRAAVHGYNKLRAKVNESSLGRVADIVRQHPKAEGERGNVSTDAYDAIMDEFGVTARTAQLWVKRARDRGYL